jgi:peptidoglycan/LPS O-acetylase OafA/YrhL
MLDVPSALIQYAHRKAVCFYSHQPAQMSPTNKRYPNFDVLRLLLAAEVAAVHVCAHLDPNFDWPGFVMAVPAFLGISGFLVLQSYSESGSWRVFAIKRTLRILPALLVSFALCLVLFDWQLVRNSGLLWISGGLYRTSGLTNVPLWSLAWEELAYLGLAVLWWLGAYHRPFFIWLLWAVSIGVVWVSASRLEPSRLIILFLGPAFFTGNLMFIYRRYLLAVPSYLPWIAFYIMLRWHFVPESRFFGGAMLLLVQTFSVVWVGMAGATIFPFRLPDISYSVYIYHFPILVFIANRCNPTSVGQLAAFTAMALVPLCLGSWYLVEKPMLRLKPANIGARPRECEVPGTAVTERCE